MKRIKFILTKQFNTQAASLQHSIRKNFIIHHSHSIVIEISFGKIFTVIRIGANEIFIE